MAHARHNLFEAHELPATPWRADRQTLRDRGRDQGAGSRGPIADPPAARQTRKQLAKADATAKAIDYSLKRWHALTLYLDDGNVPICNNAVENSIRPLALGRPNWLFVGSQVASERAANIMSLIESAKLNGHDPRAHLKDVFERTLLPHNWCAPVQPRVGDIVPAAA